MLVAPHPDDEVFGAGGTACLLARSGALVVPVIVARGDGGVTGGADPGEREAESRRCCEILGLGEPHFLRRPSGELREDPSHVAVGLSEACGRDPAHLVLVPWPLERHATHRATLAAGLLGVAALTSATWLGYGVWDAIPADPDVLEVDVTAVRSEKTRGMAAHVSQNRDRALAAGMAARDMSQAVFSRITGEDARKSVERLVDLTELARAPRPECRRDVSLRIREWAAGRALRRCDDLWPES